MAVLFVRNIGPVVVDAVLEESVEREMEVPEHPVERGAKTSDHAYRRPSCLSMTCANNEREETYRALCEIQDEAEPFDIVSGFDLHRSMLLRKIKAKRDGENDSILAYEVELKEIIIVDSEERAAGDGQAGRQKTSGDDRGTGTRSRGQVQARQVDTSSGRGEAVLRDLEPVR